MDAIEVLRQRPGLPRRPLVLTFGDGGFIREEKRVIKMKGLDEYLDFLPFTPNAAATIKGLDVIVMPSLREACGLLAMEAMVAGTRLIGTNCGGLREVLEKTPARVVPPRDAGALAAALIEEMENLSKAKAQAFAKEAAYRFDVKKQAAEIEKLMVKRIKGE